MGELTLLVGMILKWTGIALSPFLLLPVIVLVSGPRFKTIWNPVFKAVDAISSALLQIAKVAALFMIFAQLAVIAGRYVFGWSASWLNESVVYAFAMMFILGAASALKFDEHVRVDIFRNQMSDRLKAIIDFAGHYLFLFPVCLLILWAVIRSPSFAESWLSFEGSRESDGLPIYYLFRTLIPVFAISLIVQGIVQATKAALIIRGETSLTPPAKHAGAV